jgi:creatinine amidohydrolase/Fe(II)-dependent formamide hydrolase-like protein
VPIPLNTDQIRALDRSRTVVVIPGGILEEHGPYMPSYIDGYWSERAARDLGEAIAARPGWTALLFPPVPWGRAANIMAAARFSGKLQPRAPSRCVRGHMDSPTPSASWGFLDPAVGHGSPTTIAH